MDKMKKNSVFSFLCRETPSFPYCVSFQCVFFSLTQNTSLLTILVTKGVEVFFLHNEQFSVTPAGCPAVELSSNTTWRECQPPQAKDSIPQSPKSPSLQLQRPVET